MLSPVTGYVAFAVSIIMRNGGTGDNFGRVSHCTLRKIP
jgi:hypothetical protein